MPELQSRPKAFLAVQLVFGQYPRRPVAQSGIWPMNADMAPCVQGMPMGRRPYGERFNLLRCHKSAGVINAFGSQELTCLA